MGTYNIWDSCGFELLQAIRDVEKYNYNLMILNETKIFDEITVTTAWGMMSYAPRKQSLRLRGTRGGLNSY